MANAIYPKGKEAFLNGDIDMGVATIKCALSRNTYGATDDFYDDVSADTVDTEEAITTKTFTNGQFNGDDVTFTAVGAGAACNALIIYEDTGTASTSHLIAFIDTGTGMPVTPSGGDITVTWDTYIFAL